MLNIEYKIVYVCLIFDISFFLLLQLRTIHIRHRHTQFSPNYNRFIFNIYNRAFLLYSKPKVGYEIKDETRNLRTR